MDTIIALFVVVFCAILLIGSACIAYEFSKILGKVINKLDGKDGIKIDNFKENQKEL